MGQKTFVPIIIVALLLGFAWWALKDLHVEASWDPDWPETLRVSGEAVESADPGADGKISQGELAQAEEKALWTAYYLAQLRAAERLQDMKIEGQTTIRNLDMTDQELRTSIDATLKAAQEVERHTETLDDAVRATVVVEIPREPLASLRDTLGAALQGGRLKIERRPPSSKEEPEEVAQVTESSGGEAETATQVPARSTPVRESSPPARSTPRSAPPAEAVSPPPTAPAVRRPPPRPKPNHTGAVIVLGRTQGLSGATTIYDAAGTELGTTFDLPSDRRTSGFRLVSKDQPSVWTAHVGGSPQRFSATVSRGDLYLQDRLNGEQVRAFKSWLQDGNLVLVLGDARR